MSGVIGLAVSVVTPQKLFERRRLGLGDAAAAGRIFGGIPSANRGAIMSHYVYFDILYPL